MIVAMESSAPAAITWTNGFIKALHKQSRPYFTRVRLLTGLTILYPSIEWIPIIWLLSILTKTGLYYYYSTGCPFEKTSHICSKKINQNYQHSVHGVETTHLRNTIFKTGGWEVLPHTPDYLRQIFCENTFY